MFPKSCDNIPLVLGEGRNTFSFSCVSKTYAQISANSGALDTKMQHFKGSKGVADYNNYAVIIVPAAPIYWFLGANLASGCTINSLAVLIWEFNWF